MTLPANRLIRAPRFVWPCTLSRRSGAVMVEEVEESIRVIASNSFDRALMNILLIEAGLRTGSGPQCCLESADDALAAGVCSRRATIFCHRTSAGVPGPSLHEVELRGRVIVFSDCVDETIVVAALEGGAHHYFDITEPRPLMRARLVAALRSHTRQLQRELLVPPFRFDPAKRRVSRGGLAVGLSPKEFELAFYLFSHRGRTVGNHELMTAVWSLPRTMDSRRIDTAACRIRKKMGLGGDVDGWQLKRLRGSGYMLVEKIAETN